MGAPLLTPPPLPTAAEGKHLDSARGSSHHSSVDGQKCGEFMPLGQPFVNAGPGAGGETPVSPLPWLGQHGVGLAQGLGAAQWYWDPGALSLMLSLAYFVLASFLCHFPTGPRPTLPRITSHTEPYSSALS